MVQTDDEVFQERRVGFERFAGDAGERLRRALVAGYGIEIGNDACDEALAYAWEHWERVGALANPVGYLYRVGQSATRRHRRWRRRAPFPGGHSTNAEPLDPQLSAALGRLTQPQRTCVVLVHIYDWSYQHTADALNLSVASVRNHLHRGLAALRNHLEV